MPPKNVDNGPTRATGRGKRPMPSRVVPAIPLALTKPKISRQQPGASNDVTTTTRPSTAISSGDDDQNSQHDREGAGLAKQALKPTSTVSQPSGLQQELEYVDGANTETFSTPSVLHNHNQVIEPESAGLGSQVGHNVRPPTPPPTDEEAATSPTVTASPETARKPTERFDIRQIRTEFPPVFVPAAEQHTPHSAASSQTRPQLPMHHPKHPSTSSIVFGGRNSSNSSPAPTQTTASAFAPPTYPGPPPPGHAYHVSEPFAQRMQHPSYQPPGPWTMRPGYGPPIHQPQPFFHPPPHVPFRYPPREMFAPVVSTQLNGHDHRSREGSQSSSAAATGAAAEGQRFAPDLQSPLGFDSSTEEGTSMPVKQARNRLPPFFPQPPMLPPQFQHPDFAAASENLESLRVHLSSQLGVADFADCQLHIVEKRTGSRQSLHGHRVVLARSPKLLQILREHSSSVSPGGELHVPIHLEGQYLRIPPFMDAIRYLYGGPLPPIDLYRSTGEPALSNEERMLMALQYIAVGAWLQVSSVSQKAIEIAASLLHWDTLSSALAFALEGGLSQAWTTDDGGAERVSTCSSDDSLGKPEMGGTPTYDPHATYMLHRIIAFMVHTLPSNFYLDSSAPELATCPRLPAISPMHQSRPSRSDPRLSKIRFGEIPIEDHQRPSPAATTISSVLLSLPFPLLKPLLEHYDLIHRLGPETVSSIMRSVIQERENRRQKALKALSSPPRDDGADSQLTQNMYWVEFVEPSHQHRTGCRLARRRRGIDTPSSSGAESDRYR